MKKFIAGNWKMNGSLAANEKLVHELLDRVVARPATWPYAFPAPIYRNCKVCWATSVSSR